MQPYSLYLHIPFCVHRCAYCDFNTYASLGDLIEPYTQALVREIAISGHSAQAAFHTALPVHTVFFGGGTPSLLSLDQLGRIISALHQSFDLQPGCELTLEANPGTLSADFMFGLEGLGINRLSLGMQSANPWELKLLERQHNLTDVIQAVSWTRQAGISNINLDLIFGLPYQSVRSWENTLHMAISLQTPHLSLYSLTLEHGTPLANWVNRGLVSEPDGNLAAEMYELSMRILAENGYAQYEISNWARPAAAACRHNLQYWRGYPWLGLGAGAHGYIPGLRTVNILAPAAYIQRLSNTSTSSDPFPLTPATQDQRRLSSQDEQGEYMMMALRLTEAGVADHEFTSRFGISLHSAYSRQIRRLIRKGLIEWTGSGNLRLTYTGRMLGNQVFMEFI